METVFISGTNPDLSLAEIFAVASRHNGLVTSVSGPAVTVEFPNRPDVPALMSELGGTVKIGEAVADNPTPDRLAEILKRKRLHRPVFGISLYPNAPMNRRRESDALRSLIRLGMETKRLLKEDGIASRFVRPQEGLGLSSVAADKNGLTGGDGAEFLIYGDGRLALMAAVQPFEDFSKADFGRPSRNARQGMLPPKLARIMVNLSGARKGGSLWDPFCGSGTVLSEAARLGLKRIFGTDISPQAIKDSERNLEWLKGEFPEIAGEFFLVVSDAREPVAFLPAGRLEAVVSETYLGEPRQGRESRLELNRRLKEISALVAESLSAWMKTLSPQGTVVLALPAYPTENGDLLLTEFPLPKELNIDPLLPPERAGGRLTERGGLIYGRPGQMVFREIVRFRRRSRPARKGS